MTHALPNCLQQISKPKEAPLDTYILYKIKSREENGGLYFLNPKDYWDFVSYWMKLESHRLPLTMDLFSTGVHSLILDIDNKQRFHSTEAMKKMWDSICFTDCIESLLKKAFLPVVKNFTYILSTRPNSLGVHIHLPEFKIGADDYIVLCQVLQKHFEMMKIYDHYKLDILQNVMLPGAAKPDQTCYEPRLVAYVDEQRIFKLHMTQLPENLSLVKKKFPLRKDNTHSFFRRLLYTHDMLWNHELTRLTMPVVKGIYNLVYETSISKVLNGNDDWQNVATFTFKKSNTPGYICKCLDLSLESTHTLKVYYYLKQASRNLTDMQTNNVVLKRWHKRFCQFENVDASHIPKLFRDLHELLQMDHVAFAQHPNPLQEIMQYNRGTYFLPVFYYLCKHYRKDSRAIAQELYALLDPPFHPLLEKLQKINPYILDGCCAEITINTLYYCANNYTKEKTNNFRQSLKSIIQSNQRAILSVITAQDLTDCVRSLQERYIPIKVLKLRNALKDPSRYIWNVVSDTWQKVNRDTEITDHVQNLWSHVRQFLIEYIEARGKGAVSMDVVKSFKVQWITSSILSDSNIDQQFIQMDDHKWFLRIHDGVLDLLTSHVGGVVPEYFISDLKLHLDVPRSEFIDLCNRSSDLYQLLTNELFFATYLEKLMVDETDCLFKTLCRMVSDHSIDVQDKIHQSMLHFYVNLCKYTSFEYDLLLYLLDTLASVLVGTNYERKFFVWKGVTRNGKSKLMEIMHKALGGYFQNIQSDNLWKKTSANGPAPELASTLFSRRIISLEELEKKVDENRVKQITGNSFVTFRNLYEANCGGIPMAKTFALTNNFPECKGSTAFKDRVVCIYFEAEFSNKPPGSTSQQLTDNVYELKESYLVESSYLGCFFMLYYHLMAHVNPEDCLLHYRPEPECVMEFTEDYLIMADTYSQFKTEMDVQIKQGCSTSMTDLKSAVRQFFKNTKTKSVPEEELYMCFEEEFKGLRRTDIQLDASNAFSYSSMAEEMPAKKPKLDSSVILYEGVVIKNLKRSSLEY